MKPREFDELVKQKFDQNDFAYNPRNWDQLAEQLDGRAKKRSIIMWWWVPLAGMAASVALAMGVSPLMKQAAPGNTGSTTGNGIAQTRTFAPSAESVQRQITMVPAPAAHNEQVYASAVNNEHKKAVNKPAKNVSEWFHVVLNNDEQVKTASKTTKTLDFAANTNGNNSNALVTIKKETKKEIKLANEEYSTFVPEEEAPAKAPKVSIILSGGYNRGNQNAGYMAGATFRRMINDKLYVESDVAFATSTNSQTTQVWVPDNANGARHSGAKGSTTEASKATPINTPKGSIQTQDQNYTLSYAQVSPSIGYKIIKRMSVGVGPDFQRMLVDNRPAKSTVEREAIQVAPVMDIGFVGKTEYALTKRIKAGVSYRKGVNNVIATTDKYVDRDYLQFQLKCTILNR